VKRQYDWNGLPVPYIAAWEREKDTTPRIVLRNVRGVLRIGYESENPYDRDENGTLWAGQALAQGRGMPHFENVHLLRQRRAMRDLLCQVCGTSTLTGPGPGPEPGHLWLLAARPGDPGPIREGEVTTSPPVCTSCAPAALTYCPHLRRGAVAARVGLARYWGVAGVVHDRRLQPIPGPDLALVRDDSADLRWILAYRLAVELRDVTPVDIHSLCTENPVPRRPN
jgi:hypothetical protein